MEDLNGAIEELTFPEANLDGSITDLGTSIVLAADVFFAYNDASRNDRARAEIPGVVAKLRDAPGKALTVVGHTDSDGADSANQVLSQRRAQSVKDALAAQLPGVTITAEGKDEPQPVAENDTPENRAKNRRVEIRIAN